MKILTVVGARPQFIKAAAVSRILRKNITEVLVHTGQHYDHNMSQIFFDELDIPRPDYNLGISGGSHGKMTGEMLIKIEEVLLKENPDMLLVYGDTNSTLAGALAAAKLHVPICHVEAGARSYAKNNPEEINRICTDHISELLMCCTELGVEFLKKENITDNVHFVGDPMYDAFVYYSEKAKVKNRSDIVSLDGESVCLPEKFYYMTCHREENTKQKSTLIEILKAMNSLDYKTIYPVHPRNQRTVREICSEQNFDNVIFVAPVGYLTSISLVNQAERIVTDSGGLQREAFFAKKPCVTIFGKAIWPETMINNMNCLSLPNSKEILEKLSVKVNTDFIEKPFGDGHAGDKIVRILSNYR